MKVQTAYWGAQSVAATAAVVGQIEGKVRGPRRIRWERVKLN